MHRVHSGYVLVDSRIPFARAELGVRPLRPDWEMLLSQRGRDFAASRTP